MLSIKSSGARDQCLGDTSSGQQPAPADTTQHVAGPRKRGPAVAPELEVDVELPLRTLAGRPAYGLSPDRVIAYNLAQARDFRAPSPEPARRPRDPTLGPRSARSQPLRRGALSYTAPAGKLHNFDANKFVATSPSPGPPHHPLLPHPPPPTASLSPRNRTPTRPR